MKPEDAAQFRWIAETATVQSYRHTETGRHIHIDQNGFFYRQDVKLTSQEAALDRAMPEGRKPSQMEYGQSLGMGR